MGAASALGLAALLATGCAPDTATSYRPQERGLATAVAQLNPTPPGAGLAPPAIQTAASVNATALTAQPPPTVVLRPTEANPAIPATAVVTPIAVSGVPTEQALPQLAVPYPDVSRVPPEQARAMLESGLAVAADVRSRAEYDQGHLPGAVLVAVGEAAATSAAIPRDRTVILYCT